MAANTVTTTHIATWGIQDVHTGQTIFEANASNSVCLSFSQSSEPVMAPETNEVGSTIGQALYDIHTTCRATMNVKKAVAVAIKAYYDDQTKYTVQCVIDSVKYYATNLEVVESNTDYMKFNVALEKYLHEITPWDATQVQSS